MSERNSILRRLSQFFRPQTETYDTRRSRGGEAGDPLPTQYYDATDRRRFGGSHEIGAG